MTERALASMKQIRESIGAGESHVLDVVREVERLRVGAHQVQVVDTKFGRTFVLDGRLQSTELDEYVYHETLVHPAMIAHSAPQRVVCIGGSTGAILREMLRWPSVTHAKFVEADSALLELTRRHLPHLGADVLHDSRVELLNLPLVQWLAHATDTVDVIVVDGLELPQAKQTSTSTFDEELLRRLRARIGSGGVIAIAAGAARTGADGHFVRLRRQMEGLFPHTVPFSAFVPSLGTPWGFLVATQNEKLEVMTPTDVDLRLVGAGVTGLRYLSGDILAAARTLGSHSSRLSTTRAAGA